MYKDFFFILQTRGLYNWIFSRIKHYYKIELRDQNTNRVYLDWKNNNKIEVIKKWIIKRNNWHYEVINYFNSNKRNKFIILNIEDDNLEENLSKFIGHDIDIVKKNQRNINVFNKQQISILKKYESYINIAFNELGINQKDYNSTKYIDYLL